MRTEAPPRLWGLKLACSAKLHAAWLNEDFSAPVLGWKTAARALVVAGLVLLGLNSEEEPGGTQMPVIQVRNRGVATATASLLRMPPE
jgi:hypothetical protein